MTNSQRVQNSENSQNSEITVLEKSTNTHITKSRIKVVQDLQTMNTMVLQTSGDSVLVEHGEHNVVATEQETPCVIKITQQEYNPISKLLQNSFD